VARQSAHKKHARRVAGRRARELLAALGIDLDEVRRRARSSAVDDPAQWELRRSRLRPLRVSLVGPGGVVPLDGRSQWHAAAVAGR
jgi:hypothetical protein